MPEPMADGAYFKEAHKRGCDGALYNIRSVAHVDKTGRVDNGGIVAHDYRCNMAWDGCPARVLVLERAVRELACAVERRTG